MSVRCIATNNTSPPTYQKWNITLNVVSNTLNLFGNFQHNEWHFSISVTWNESVIRHQNSYLHFLIWLLGYFLILSYDFFIIHKQLEREKKKGGFGGGTPPILKVIKNYLKVIYLSLHRTVCYKTLQVG